MKKIKLLTALLLYSTLLFGQENQTAFYKQQIELALTNGKCENAQILYDIYKNILEKKDIEIEARINDCLDDNNRASTTLQGIKLLHIQGGTFLMGSPESESDRMSNETQHSVTLDDFYLSATVITCEQYCRFLNETKVSSDGKGNIQGYGYDTLVISGSFSGVIYTNKEWRPDDGKNHFPVRAVSWFGAKAFCDWAGGRLPTEAEWEYACRAGTTTPFNTGEILSVSQANFGNNSVFKAVRSYEPNNWGLYEMHGNVSEWCNDWYSYYGTSPVTNPKGPSTGRQRVIRGGCYHQTASYSRSAYRTAVFPNNHRSLCIGFRIALSASRQNDTTETVISTPSQTDSLKSSLKIIKGIKFIRINEGSFLMGSHNSERGRLFYETQHLVTLSSFFLSEKEITNEQYCIFLNANKISKKGTSTMKDFIGLFRFIKAHKYGVKFRKGAWYPALGKENHPVVNVSWYGSKAYCDWIGGRLPTEAEWEYACRAGTNTRFNVGDILSISKANFLNKYGTRMVGSYSPNAFGLYDMHGNAAEWCNDWFERYGTSDEIDPKGPSIGTNRIVRGGSWAEDVRFNRSAYRKTYFPDDCNPKNGFRVAFSINE